MQEVYDSYDDGYVSDAQIRSILGDYQRKTMVENLTGPGVSLVCHMVLLILGFVYITTASPMEDPPLVVQTVIVPKLKIDDPPPIDQLEDIEDPTDVKAPTTDPTDVPDANPSDDSSPVDVSDAAPSTDDDTDLEQVVDTVMTNSILTFPGEIGGRNASGRKRALGKHRAGGGGILAVNRALRWLASVQNANGSWGTKGEKNWGPELGEGHPAHTGIALLVFLAHGETPISETYGKTVQNAMRWLAQYGSQSDLEKYVKKKTGAYTHGIATYAISESYAMTKIPFVQGAMENSIDVIIRGQMGNGGFGYGYSSDNRWDTSVAGWNFQALKAARMAGCTNERLKDAIRKSISFCKKTAYAGNGQFGYATEAKPGKKNMTGIGTVAMQLLGASDDKCVVDACAWIGNERLKKYEEVMVDPSKWEGSAGACLYGWYYDTQAMFNTHDKEKARWKRWQKAFETVLTRSQHQEGFWQTNGHHGIGAHDTSGRVLATCLAALQLEVYYRYLPTFNKSKVDEFDARDLEDGIAGVGDGDGGGMIIQIGD